MPKYDWMSDPSFRNRIKDKVSRSAGTYGMEEYRTAITGWIAEKIENNAERHVSTEMLKEASQQRDDDDALESVDLLMKYACQRASSDGRKLVTLEDVQAEFDAHFCNFWPIC